MTTSTDIAVGLPATATTQLVYPVTARVDVSDNYNGEKVDDPYRWLENLDSKATQDWVSAQNKPMSRFHRNQSYGTLGSLT